MTLSFVITNSIVTDTVVYRTLIQLYGRSSSMISRTQGRHIFMNATEFLSKMPLPVHMSSELFVKVPFPLRPCRQVRMAPRPNFTNTMGGKWSFFFFLFAFPELEYLLVCLFACLLAIHISSSDNSFMFFPRLFFSFCILHTNSWSIACVSQCFAIFHQQEFLPYKKFLLYKK